MEINKPELALKLLELEPIFAKQIPVLLWMAKEQNSEQLKYYDKAIQQAVKIRDSNLINLVIINVLESNLSKSMQYQILNEDPMVKQHLKLYLK